MFAQGGRCHPPHRHGASMPFGRAAGRPAVAAERHYGVCLARVWIEHVGATRGGAALRTRALLQALFLAPLVPDRVIDDVEAERAVAQAVGDGAEASVELRRRFLDRSVDALFEQMFTIDCPGPAVLALVENPLSPEAIGLVVQGHPRELRPPSIFLIVTAVSPSSVSAPKRARSTRAPSRRC